MVSDDIGTIPPEWYMMFGVFSHEEKYTSVLNQCIYRFCLALPVNVLASSSQYTYSPALIQTALCVNMKMYYYTFKDRLIKNPEHTVSDVKVLYSTQHDRTVILVGSCLIDRKENIISGTLTKDKSTGKMHLGGGWIEASTMTKPLFYTLFAINVVFNALPNTRSIRMDMRTKNKTVAINYCPVADWFELSALNINL